MSEIKWISASDGVWSDTANWDGNVVPGQNDVALFDGTALGQCTVDINPAGAGAIGGLKIMQAYGDRFLSNGKTFDVYGPCWILNNGTNANWPSPTTINHYGNDVALAMDNYSITHLFHVNCDLRISGSAATIGNNALYVTTIDAGVTVTCRTSPHPEITGLAWRNFRHGGKTFTNNGVLDVTECSEVIATYANVSPQFLSYGEIRSSKSTPINLSFGLITRIVIASVSGRFTATVSPYNVNVGGNLHLLESLTFQQAVGYDWASKNITFAANTTLPSTVFNAAAQNAVVSAAGEVSLYGDLSVIGAFQYDMTGLMFRVENNADIHIDVRGNWFQFMGNQLAGKIVIINGDVELCGDTSLNTIDFDPDWNGIFRFNGYKLHVNAEEWHWTNILHGMIEHDGYFIFSGRDYAIRDISFPEGASLTFTNHCKACFFSSTGKYQLGNLYIEKNAKLMFSQPVSDVCHDGIASILQINGDLMINGSLEISGTSFRLNMIKNGSVFSAGTLIACQDSTLIIGLGSSKLKPEVIHTEGNVHFEWASLNTTATLLPGDYRGISQLVFPENITTINMESGDYYFSKVQMMVASGECKRLKSDTTSHVRCLGELDFLGKNGAFQSEIKFLEIEHANIEALFLFDENILRINHPNIIPCGKIEGIGVMQIQETSTLAICHEDAIDVGQLTLIDCVGMVTVPIHGYRSLAFEAESQNTYMTIHGGKYHMENLFLNAHNRTLTIDMTRTTQFVVSKDISVQTTGNGSVRFKSNGSDEWILQGTDTQVLNLPLEYGYHVLGHLVNENVSGDIVISSPLAVTDFHGINGTPLVAPTNMTILSRIQLQGHVCQIAEGIPGCIKREGFVLKNGKVLQNGTVRLYAKLTDQKEQPILPELIEEITVELRMMNPIAPHLHQPRKEIVSHVPILKRCHFYPEIQQESIPASNDMAYNLSFASDDIDAIRFSEPGLYYLMLNVKLFGHQRAQPIRYELYCERNM